MAPAELKNVRLDMRMTPTEREMLDELADEYGQTVSDYLRHVIRREYEATFKRRQPKKPKQ